MTASSSAVDQLAEDFWDRFLELSPLSATLIGDHRFDDRMADPGPVGRARARELATWVRDAAMAVPDTGLSVEERITRDMLRVVGEVFIEDDEQRFDTLQVVDQMSGPQSLLPQLTQFQPATIRSASKPSRPACAPTRRSWPPTASSSARRSRAA